VLLVSNGCSHTAGAELEYPQQGECYNKAWPRYLADDLDLDHINISMAGASTHRIIRTTYEFIYDWVKQRKDTKELLFIILWPGTHRTEVYCDDNHIYNYDNRWAPIVVGNDSSYKQVFSTSLYNYYKSWTTNTTEYQSSSDFYIDVTNLQNLFYRYGIKHLFMDATNSGLLTMDKSLDKYRIHIDKKYYEGFDNRDNCYVNLCKYSNQKISKYSVDSGFNSHYDEDAQIWFAKYTNMILYKRNIL